MKPERSSFVARSARLAARLGVVALVAGCAAGGKPQNAGDAALAMQAARAGGTAIYLRHTQANVGADRPEGAHWWRRCGDGHRMLSEAGRAHARAMGEALRTLGVRVAAVYSSEYCRALETSRLMALADPIEDAGLTYWHAWRASGDEAAQARMAQGTRARLSAAPPAGTNVLLVSHRQDFACRAHAALDSLAEGEAAVFRPDGAGGFVLLGRVKAEDWLKAAGLPSARGGE